MSGANTFQKVLEDDAECLDQVMGGLRKFQDKFCENMNLGRDFTIKLEINGNKGTINHVRCYVDEIDRPSRKRAQ